MKLDLAGLHYIFTIEKYAKLLGPSFSIHFPSYCVMQVFTAFVT